MASRVTGRDSWWSERDNDGYRTYHIIWRINCLKSDGLAAIMNTPGLPGLGSFWAFGGDIDPWAFCYPYLKVKMDSTYKSEPAEWYTVEQTFSQRPLHRCQDTPVQDPLLEPQRISGTFIRDRREMVIDANGNPIQYSNLEPVRGPGAEFDFNRPTVQIKQNQATLGLNIFAPLIDTVNAFPLWGLPPRTIKFSSAQWERVLFGICNYYYTITLIFEIDNIFTWDHFLVDQGNWVLNGAWTTPAANTSTQPALAAGWKLFAIDGTASTYPVNPNPLNPAHYIRSTDRAGNPKSVLLNGGGVPLPQALTGPVVACLPGQGGVIQIESPNHLLNNGNTVTVTGVKGVPGANITTTVKVVDPDDFTLDGTTFAGLFVPGGGGWQASVTGLQRPFVFQVAYYPGADFSVLGVPVSF